jgi:hypothetical protein
MNAAIPVEEAYRILTDEKQKIQHCRNNTTLAEQSEDQLSKYNTVRTVLRSNIKIQHCLETVLTVLYFDI